MENTAVKAEKKKVGNPINIFFAGVRKGVNIWLNTMIPSATLCYTLLQVLTLIGFTDLMATIFSPVMAIFGLPGEAMIALVAGFGSKSNGCATAAGLFAEGLLTEKHVAVILLSCMCGGGIMPQWPRTISTSGTDPKLHIPLIIITLLAGMVGLWVGALVF